MLLRSSPASSHISPNPDIKTIFDLFTEPSRPLQYSCHFAFETPSILVPLRLRDPLNPRAASPSRYSTFVQLCLSSRPSSPSIPLRLPCCLWWYVNVERAFGFVQAEDELVEDFIRGTILSFIHLLFVYLFLPSIVLFFHSFYPLSVLEIFFSLWQFCFFSDNSQCSFPSRFLRLWLTRVIPIWDYG